MSKTARPTPVEVAVPITGDAWSVLVLREAVLFRTRRFVDFRDSLQLNRATLADRLSSLVSADLLSRESVSAASDRSRYRPTGTATAYLPVLLSMLEWGRRWQVDPGEGLLLRVAHTSCGAPLSTSVICSACGGPVDPRSVEAERPGDDIRRGQPDISTRLPDLQRLECGHPCPIARCLAGIGDRWGMLVIQEAFFGLHTFDAFARRLGIASNTLSNRLARLCAHGILARRGDGGRGGYRLTEKGLDLYRVPATVRQWSITRLGAVDEPPIRHRWCGSRLQAELRCIHCGTVVDPGAVDASWDSPRF